MVVFSEETETVRETGIIVPEDVMVGEWNVSCDQHRALYLTGATNAEIKGMRYCQGEWQAVK